MPRTLKDMRIKACDAHNLRAVLNPFLCKNFYQLLKNISGIMGFENPARMRTQAIGGQSDAATVDRPGDVCAAEKYAHKRIMAG